MLVLAVASVCLAQKPYIDEEVPKPYNYQYAVADDYSKANFQKTESQDANVSHQIQRAFLIIQIFSGQCTGAVCDSSS